MTDSFFSRPGCAFGLLLAGVMGMGTTLAAQAPAPIAPRLPITRDIDSGAVQLLMRANTTLRQANSLTATTKTVFSRAGGQENRSEYQVRYMRPNYMWRVSPDTTKQATICTPTNTIWYLWGNTAAAYDHHDNRCDDALEPTLHAFFTQSSGRLLEASEWDTGRLTDPLLRSVKSLGRESWNGASYDVVQWVYEQSYPMPEDTLLFTTRVFLDSATHVRRIVTKDSKGNQTDYQVLSLAVNPALSERDFVWTPPKSVTIKPITLRTPPLPRLGQQFSAMDVEAPIVGGSPKSIRQLMAGKKKALLWFWNTTCLSCMHEFPHMEQLARDLNQKDVAVIVLDMVDTPDEAKNALRYRNFYSATMPILVSEPVTKAIISDRSSSLIIDASGKILDDDAFDLDRYRAVLTAK